MKKELFDIVNYKRHPLDDLKFREQCKALLNYDGSLVLENFLLPSAISLVLEEALAKEKLAYFCINEHNVYLTTQNSGFPAEHIQARSSRCKHNREIGRASCRERV